MLVLFFIALTPPLFPTRFILPLFPFASNLTPAIPAWLRTCTFDLARTYLLGNALYIVI